jgi:hypothetical protein
MKISNLTVSERFFNASALISLLASISLWFTGFHEASIFVGLWVPSIIGWMNFFTSKDRLLRNQREILREEQEILEEMRELSTLRPAGSGGGSTPGEHVPADAPSPSASNAGDPA